MEAATLQEARQQLASDFGGRLIGPEDPDYDEARRVINGMIDKRPALVARPRGVADVIAAVRYAREQGLPIAVRSGGHSFPGHGTNDDGLVIDLSLLKGIHVDPHRRVVRAQGGVLWGELDRETQAFGMATPGGRVTTTGVGGFTLGGGYGWLSPKYGLTCDNLISADVVTADVRFVTASDVENEELFWALRGGGGNFGVVTSFEFRLWPVGPLLYGGLMAFPLERAEEVVSAWRDLAGDDAPDELSTGAALVTAPPADFVPEEARLRPAVGVFGCWCGDVDEGAAHLAPLRKLGPLVDLFGPLPYRALQGLLDPMNPPYTRTYARGEHLAGLSDEAVAAFAAHDTTGLHPLTVGVLFQHGGAVNRVPEDATAFSHRDTRFMVHPIGIWDRPEDDEKHRAWVKALSESMRPFRSGGVYLNFSSETTPERVREGFGDVAYDRLVDVKNAYDPDNVFRFNQNIAPTVD